MTETEKTEIKLSPITNTVFDLDTMEEVTLVKDPPAFSPATSLEAAASLLGNDSAKLLAVINDGLMAHFREAAKNDPAIPWMTVEEDDNGKEVKTPFSGTIADSAKVNGLILNMAKSVFGYKKDMVPGDADKNRAAKKAAKEQAMDLIKNTPPIREGLKNSTK